MQKKISLFSILLTIFLLVGCREPEEITVVVTQIVTIEGEDQIVTRLVTATPNPVNIPQSKPVILDYSITTTNLELDPQSANAVRSLDILENIFIGLTNFDPATNEITPELAESWEISPDGRLWTFHLRSDINWLSSQAAAEALNERATTVPLIRPVTASDVVFSIRRACDPRTNMSDVFILFIIEGCEAVHNNQAVSDELLNQIGAVAIDDQTLQIQLTGANGHFLAITSMWILMPLPAEQIIEFGNEWTTPRNIWVNGPFIPNNSKSVPGQLTLLHRNPMWPIPFKGNVDQVHIFQLPDAEDSFGLWEDRMLDVSPLPSSKRAAMLADSPQRVKLVPEQTVFYLTYNFDSPVFREAEVRRAFGAAIDRERLVREIYGGRGLPMRHFTPPGVLSAPPFDEVGTGYSPDYARQQMANSSFVHCRLLPPFRYLISASDQSLQLAELLREMWVEELGCREDQIIIEQVPFGALLAQTRIDANNKRPDMWDLGWASYYPDAHNWNIDLLHCTLSENRQKRSCSEVDGIMDQLSTTSDQAARNALFRQIENLFYAPGGLEPLSPLYARSQHIVVQNWVGFSPSGFGGEQFDTYMIDARIKELERDR